MSTVRSALRVPDELDLAGIDPRGRPVGPHDTQAAAAATAEPADELDTRQEALHAEAAGGGRRAVLLVLQGTDTSGEGGVIPHAVGPVDPQGLAIASFTKPTQQERGQHFLPRVRARMPAPGLIGVFDRSHHEDVLVARVASPVPEGVVG
jgi:polyphosphate kinase 2 (PPK2 family)